MINFATYKTQTNHNKYILMKKTIALLISCILMATMSLAQVNPIAGVYKYTHPDGAEGTIYVATGQGGNVYFEASSEILISYFPSFLAVSKISFILFTNCIDSSGKY